MFQRETWLAMSVDNNELFELLRLASFENEFKISSSAFTESRNNVYGFVVSENKKIHFCHYPKHRKEEKQKQCPKSKLETKKSRANQSNSPYSHSSQFYSRNERGIQDKEH